ncbi:MAG TPA: ATP synthase subunit I [Anaerolineaceae bacterium]|nr:ATP synthase subunit I [Anaerolineaceae bacterium]
MTFGDVSSILLALGGGFLVGFVYFWSLRFTIAHMVTTKHPALVMIGSYFLRTVFMLLAFYLIMDGELMRLIACLVGFILARIVLVKRTGPQKPTQA